MKKFDPKTLDFPIVIKKLVDDIVISTPDLGFFKSLKPQYEKAYDESSKSAKILITEDFKNTLIKEIENMWSQIETHREHKKWQPLPSSFRQTLSAAEEDYSLPDFVKKLNAYISISENTVRREIKRGQIRCYQTEGGHRRIPSSEISNYLEKIKTDAKENNP